MGAFSGSLGSLWVEVGARIAKFEAGMATVSKQVDATTKEVEAKFGGLASLGPKLAGIGTGLSAAVTLPLVGIGVASAKMATDFQSALNKVSALGEITGNDLKTLEAKALEFGAQTKFSATEAAQGMAELAAAGSNTSQILAAMPGILNLAAAGEISIADAAKIATDAITQFGLTSTDSVHIADVLASAAAKSKDSVAGLGQALSFVGLPAKAAGLSFEQTAAALAILSNAGLRGERSGTGLRNVLESLVKPTDKARDAFEAMGVQISDSSGKLLPPLKILENLSGKTLGFGEAATIAGIEGSGALIALAAAGTPALQGLSKEFVGVTGTAKVMSEVMQGGLPGALEKAKGSIETAGITIGKALAPAIIALAGHVETAANKIGEFATTFGKLPQPVQVAALAFVAIVAAVGPLLVIAGTLIGSITSIYTGFGLLAQAGGVAGIAVKALGAVFSVSTLATVAYTAGIVAAGVAIFQTVKAMQGMVQAQRAATTAGNEQVTAGKRLHDSLVSQGVDLRALDADFKAARITQLQYDQGVRKLAVALGDSKKATIAATPPITDLDKAQKSITAAMNAAASAATKGTSVQKAATEETNRAAIAVISLADKNPVLAATAKALNEAYNKQAEEIAKARIAFKALEGVETDLIPPTEAVKAAMDGIISSAKIMAVEIPGAAAAFAEIDAASAKIKAVEDAYTHLGIESVASLEKQVEATKKSYDIIRADATNAPKIIDAAWVKMETARIKAAEAQGAIIPAEQKKALDVMTDQVKDHTEESTGIWGNYAKQVSSIISDAGKNIISRFQDAGKENAKLKEQEDDLRASLTAREADYADFAADTAAKLAEIHVTYAADLAKEEQALQESLEERRADYAEFTADVLDKIAELKGKHQKQADKERDGLNDSLEDRTRDYEDYRQDIGEKIDEIRTNHASSARKEKQNLNDSLTERTRDYNRYVQDVTTDIARLRAKNKGQDSESEQDLRLSLARRTEDFHRYQQEVAADLAAVDVKHLEAQQKEEDDTRQSLLRKTRDFELYKADVAEKLAEITKTHAEAQAAEETDLRNSLERKGVELKKHEEDATSNLERVRQAALTKLIAQETDLTASLARQTQEWELYKTNVAEQLQEIEDKHLGIFGKIASVGIGIFTDIGAALGRFVAEELIGKLFKSLGDLVSDILPSVAKGFADIFGGSTSGIGDLIGSNKGVIGATPGVGSNIPGVGGSAPAAATGSIASSLTSMVTAIASVGSLISGVIGNFQSAKLEGTMNQVERNTAMGSIHLLHILEQTNKHLPGITDLHGAFFQYLGYFGTAQTTWEETLYSVRTIALDTTFAGARLAEISYSAEHGSYASLETNTILGTIRDLLQIAGSKPMTVNVYVAGQKQETSGVSLKLQGAQNL